VIVVQIQIIRPKMPPHRLPLIPVVVCADSLLSTTVNKAAAIVAKPRPNDAASEAYRTMRGRGRRSQPRISIMDLSNLNLTGTSGERRQSDTDTPGIGGLAMPVESWPRASSHVR